MSGRESGGGYSRRGLGIKPEDLQEFSQSTRSQGLDVNLLSRATGVFKNGSLVGGYRDPLTNDPGEAEHGRVETVLTAYNAWLKDRDAMLASHREYLKLVNDRPGRRATILVPTQEPGQDLLLTGRDVGQGVTPG